MRLEPSPRMLRARKLRKEGLTLQEIAEAMIISRQGARWLIKRSDDFLAPPHLGEYKQFKKWQNARNKSL